MPPTRAQIRWDPGDSAGERTLTGSPTVHFFNRWKPTPDPIGEEAFAIGDGRGYKWEERTDYLVSVEFPNIDHTDESLLQEFLEWANTFGIFSIDTADIEDNSYEECQVAPNTHATISDPDSETLEYTLSMTILNIAASPVPFRRVMNA